MNQKTKQIDKNPKTRLSLLPAYALTEAAKAMQSGLHYGRFDWMRGAKLSDYDDALSRHHLAWRSGEDLDPKSGIHHLAHVIVNACIVLELYAAERLEDDRPEGMTIPDFE